MNQQEIFGGAAWVGQAGCSASSCYVLRGKFSVGRVERAVLRVLGLGFFHCSINGHRVGEDLFLPLNSEFEPRADYPVGEVLTGHRIYVPEYDVAQMLHSGENTIAIHFGGGWYTFENEVKFGDPKAIWRIFGESDGTEFDFVSSESDRIAQSYVRDYSFTTMEMHDYRTGSQAMMAEDFDASEWEHASRACPPQTEYDFSDCPADGVCDRLPAVHIGTSKDGEVYDCTRNTSGYPVLRIRAARGERIRVLFSEELDQDGSINKAFGHRQCLEFISDGDEREVRPQFTWFAFRYFAVQGDAQPLHVEVVHSRVDVISGFESDNELLNWIHDTYINTQLTNMHAGIPSDCPHIERRGYTGDGQLTCHAAMSMLDARSFYKKWMQDIADTQDTLSGHIQYTAPYVRSGGGPGGWGCAIVEVPYQYYLHYGDAEVLKKYYPAMLRYFDYLEAHSSRSLVVSDKAGEWCLGDWCPPVAVILPAPFVNNYFYVKSLMRCIEIAGIIGREADIPEFENRIRERKDAMHAAYFNTWDGNYLGNRQGANAFAVDIGLGDARTYRNLVEFYKQEQSLDTGIFGTDIVARVLFEHGDGQTAMDLILSESVHSFAGMRRAGATTFWEYWPHSLTDRSHNHPMFGAVTAYLYDYLLGIRAKKGSAGYHEVEIAPVLIKGVNKISGYRILPNGRVEVAYERTGERVSMTVSLPEGLCAVLSFGGRQHELHAGRNHFSF